MEAYKKLLLNKIHPVYVAGDEVGFARVEHNGRIIVEFFEPCNWGAELYLRTTDEKGEGITIGLSPAVDREGEMREEREGI